MPFGPPTALLAMDVERNPPRSKCGQVLAGVPEDVMEAVAVCVGVRGRLAVAMPVAVAGGVGIARSP